MGFFLTGHPLDGHDEVLRRLSCIPLSQIESMMGEAVMRCAFIVETVQIRVASKTQRKFAILTISDGFERYELPIWSDLYEENSHLLRENQILCAVMHVDKKEGELKLSCKWLNELSQVNEAMIAACDQAYDKAKFHASRTYPSKAGSAKSDSKPAAESAKTGSGTASSKAPAANTALKLSVDAEKIRLSHLLHLKKIFQENRGTIPVHLDFVAEGKLIATLQIDAQWGVNHASVAEAVQKAISHIKA